MNLTKTRLIILSGVIFGIFFSLAGFIPMSFSNTDNLFINPEISQSGILVGHQVVEVKVINLDISDTDEAKVEPNVLVNGKQLRMVQSTDGNWYGYFADRRNAQIADQRVLDFGTPGQGTDFGTFCSISDGTSGTVISNDISQTISTEKTRGIALTNVGGGGNQGTQISFSDPFDDCTGLGSGNNIMNVIQKITPLNQGTGSVLAGQINLNPDAWPFIQLYALAPTGDIVIQYNDGEDIQTIIVTFFDQTITTEKLIKELKFKFKFKDLPSKVEKKLLRHLDKILKNLNDDNPNNDKNICKSLDVFINKVESQAGKKIDLDDSQELISSTEQFKQIICN